MDEYQDPNDPGIGPDGYPIYTNPNKPPEWIPGPGWWEFINGAWRWITAPAPGTVSN